MKEYQRRVKAGPKKRFSLIFTEDTYNMLEEAQRNFFDKHNRSEFYEKVMILGIQEYLRRLE